MVSRDVKRAAMVDGLNEGFSKHATGGDPVEESSQGRHDDEEIDRCE